jgi:uncharacterized membrane-anchored protein
MDARGRACIDVFFSSRYWQKLTSAHIAVISMDDIDEWTAHRLVAIRPQAIVNLKNSFTGNYPVVGARILLAAHLPLLDLVSPEAVSRVTPRDELEIEGNRLYLASALLASGRRLTPELLDALWDEARNDWRLRYRTWNREVFQRQADTMSFWLDELELPFLSTILFNREVVILSRGRSYIQDVTALRPYIRQRGAVLVGVEDGADAWLEFDFRPDIIFGRLAQVSKGALLTGAEVVFHQQTDNTSILNRLRALGIVPEVMATPLTDAEAAVLLAYLYGAKVIIWAGAPVSLFHTGCLWLRQLTGDRLVFASTVPRLYTPYWGVRQWLPLLLAGCFPALALLFIWLTR